MKAERLLELYDRVAEAPDAIVRLRRFVLDLAVRGKLVDQDPVDELASELLKRIAAETTTTLDLPKGWPAVPVGNVLDFKYGKGMKASERLAEGPVPVYGSNGIVGFTNKPLTENPAIIVGRKGSAGALNLCKGPSWTTDVAYYVEAPDFFDLRYLFLTLQALDLDALGKGVKPGLSRADAYPLPIGIPPLAEQRRIVAKVDELMALLDRLEESRKKREETRDRLTAASLARLTAPETDAEAFPTRARFALHTLPALTARADQVKQLRQTIINLAVRGKLVGQDPFDKSVAEAIAVLRNAKPGKAPKTRRRKVAHSARIPPTEYPYQLPQSWIWATTEELCSEIVDCPHSTPKFVSDGIICLDTNSIKSTGLVESKIRYVSKTTYLDRIRRLEPKPEDIVFAREGSVGESVIVPQGMQCCLGQRVMLFRPSNVVMPKYFRLALSAPESLERLMEKHKGIGARHVNVGDMRKALVPIPPRAEQKRIVAKVDALMALCDRLEAALLQADTTRARLLESLLHEALTPGQSEMEAA